MIIGLNEFSSKENISMFETKFYSGTEPQSNTRCHKNITDGVDVLECEIDYLDIYNHKMIVVGFCDSDDKFIFDKGTEILMRNGTYKPVEKLHFGDLCMTKSEIKPLKHIGEVKYVSEIYPKSNIVAVDVQNKITKKSVENVALRNGVYVKL